jgi:hypothetical protein
MLQMPAMGAGKRWLPKLGMKTTVLQAYGVGVFFGEGPGGAGVQIV